MSRTRSSIALVGLLSAFSLATFDLYQPSLSFISHYFNASPTLGHLTLSIYLFFFGISQLIWGPLVDHFGRRRLLPGSLLLAAVASIICALAPNIYVLILGRALQGVALCCSNLIAFSTSRDFEDSLERAKILSYISMIVSSSPILAPVLGSLIFTYLGWQANFILMALIALTLFIQSRKGLIESPFWIASKKPFVIKDIVTSYQQIIGIPVLWYGSLIMMFSFAAVMLSIINSSYLIIDVLGFSPFGFGIIFIFNGANIILGNYIGIGLRQYFSMPTTIYMGNILIILGGLGMLFYSSYFEFNLIALSFALIANLGISVSAPPTMSLVLTDFKENTGIALAFITSIRMFGSAILSMLVGYYLTQNLNTLSIGLMLTGTAALLCTRQFNRISSAADEDDLERAEAA